MNYDIVVRPAKYILLLLLIAGGVYISSTRAQTTVSVTDCRYLDQASTTYVLQNDVTSLKGTCFPIIARNVTFDLNGHTITYGNATAITVPNGGFETGSGASPTGWDLTNASSAARAAGSYVDPVSLSTGSYALTITTPTADQTIVSTQDVTLEANTTYSLSGVVRNKVSSAPSFFIKLNGTAIQASSTGQSNRGFKYMHTQFTTGSTQETYRVAFGVTGASSMPSGTMYVDDIKIQPVSAHGVVVGPLSYRTTERYPDITRFGDADNAIVKNGTVTQGQSGSDFAHAIVLESQSTGVEVTDTTSTVYGVNAVNILTVSPSNLNIHDNVANNNVFVIVSRDAFDGVAIGGGGGNGNRVYNNTIDGGVQSGIRLFGNDPDNPNRIYGNTIRIKTRNTNGFAIQLYGDNGGLVYDNVIDCGSGDYSCRGVGLGGNGTGTKVYNNTVTVRELARNQEYNGCQLGGAYGLQIENGSNIEVYGNTVVVKVDACEGYAFRTNPTDNSGLYIHDNSFTVQRVGDTTASAASLKISGINNTTALRFEDNIATTDDRWMYLESGNSLFQLKRTTWRVGDNPDTPFEPLFVYDWDEPTTAATNLQFIDNIFPDAETADLFTEASLMCAGGGCRTSVGDLTDRFSSFYYDWTVNYTARDNSNNPIVGATVLIRDQNGTQVHAGITDSNGQGSAVFHEFRNAGGVLTTYSPYTIVATSGLFTDTEDFTLDAIKNLTLTLDTPFDPEDENTAPTISTEQDLYEVNIGSSLSIPITISDQLGDTFTIDIPDLNTILPGATFN